MSQNKMIFALPVLCGLSAFAFGLAPTASVAATVVVDPSNMGNWAFDNRNAGGVVGAEPTASEGMVTGPATPPLGTGSAHLATGNGTTGGNGGAEIRNTGYVGTALSSITALSYSTYATAWNGQQLPYLVLYLSSGDRLFFEPTYSDPPQGPIALNTWQTWNAFTGGWYDDNGFGNPGDANVKTFAQMQAQYSTDTIVNQAGNGLGGVRFTSGFASANNKFDTNIDAFTIGINGNNTTYDFELAAASATPLPAALPLFASGLGAMGFLGWRKKRKSTRAAA